MKSGPSHQILVLIHSSTCLDEPPSPSDMQQPTRCTVMEATTGSVQRTVQLDAESSCVDCDYLHVPSQIGVSLAHPRRKDENVESSAVEQAPDTCAPLSASCAGGAQRLRVGRAQHNWRHRTLFHPCVHSAHSLRVPPVKP